ncbi:MAG: hypothetical protein SGCHY_002071 [Lobulomycetales sp.]
MKVGRNWKNFQQSKGTSGGKRKPHTEMKAKDRKAEKRVEKISPVKARKTARAVETPMSDLKYSAESMACEVKCQLSIIASLSSESLQFSNDELLNDKEAPAEESKVGRYLSLDCEMVRDAHNRSMLARASIVNWNGVVILDTFVAPERKVADYLTPISGITKELVDGAPSLTVTREKIRELLNGRILIGHSVQTFDLPACGLEHPILDTRDTADFSIFRESYARAQGSTRRKAPPLKWLAEKYLGKAIQQGAHSSVDDARACMELFKLFKEDWEKQTSFSSKSEK